VTKAAPNYSEEWSCNYGLLGQRWLRWENEKAKKKAKEMEKGREEQVLESAEWAIDRRSVQIEVEDLEVRR
jgi:hypothetical protein